MIISLHKNIKKGLNKMNFNKYKSKVYKKAKENKNNLQISSNIHLLMKIK